MEHPGAGEMPGVPRATATRSLLPMVEDAPGRGSRAVPATHVGQDPEAIARDRAGTGFFLRRSSFVPVSALPDRAPSEVAMGRRDACRQKGSGVFVPVVSYRGALKMIQHHPSEGDAGGDKPRGPCGFVGWARSHRAHGSARSFFTGPMAWPGENSVPTTRPSLVPRTRHDRCESVRPPASSMGVFHTSGPDRSWREALGQGCWDRGLRFRASHPTRLDG
mgnify:CR=1 FL=1